MEPVPILIVGVDIGMSTSGISCCLLQPGATNPCQPTSIRLHGNTHELEPTELGVKSQTYGSDIGANETRLTLLKLSMTDPKDCPWVLKDLESHDRGMIQRELNRIMTLYPETDAITEYINRLWVDGSQGVRKYLSTFNDLQPSGVEARFVFGVPAIWKQQTIREMRKAIGKSGILAFGRRQPAALDFVQEPEAAAMAVIPGVAQGRGLDVGNTILILDCGGGTVDTVVYEISSLKPVAVNEWVSPEGRFLGAIFMKSAFSSFVRGKVENQMGGDYQSVNQTALDSEIEVAWTAVEEGTIEDLTEEGVFGILSVQRTDGTYAQSVTLQKHDTHKALQTFAGRIVDFAEKQVLAADDQVTLIIVVGGFGRNAVVQDELKRRFGHELLFFTEDAG
ncbi:uncharacterized protein B0H64DRAFT_134495 [Chaetomium fimeti]|uniref:Actin-like ATPase domain-containing protein n=1 Tax=Chaetomium fimeti TaxID=1854472 RepID=A0AAE0HJY4_9PEZI|nr:hypothetical protein B0H64DRAFT_134495 [Chaetomium fimeti]